MTQGSPKEGDSAVTCAGRESSHSSGAVAPCEQVFGGAERAEGLDPADCGRVELIDLEKSFTW